MFGYIQPNVPELRIREKTRYEAWYCGLCRRIGRLYGQTARACLSYDCAFLAALLSSIDEKSLLSTCGKPRHCPFKPFKRAKPMVDGDLPALDFAAGVCVLLAVHKLDDDVRDGRPLRGIAKLPLLHAFKRAEQAHPDTAAAIRSGMEMLSLIEKKRQPSCDLAANAFGKLMADILSTAPADAKTLPVLAELGNSLGRYIYLCDAWEDRKSDEKHGLYNPFVLCGTERSHAEMLINISINSAISAYNLLDVRTDCGLIENILTQGCFATADKIFDKEDRSRK